MVFTLMTTWRTGRRILNEKLAEATLPISDFMMTVNPAAITRVPGTAVFLYRNENQLPPSLLHSLKHYKVLHERIVILTIITEEIPHISAEEERSRLEHLGHGIYRLIVRYGYMEDPDIPGMLGTIHEPGLTFETMKTTYFLGHETLIATKHPGMALWREKLFAWMMRNATSARFFFRLPPNRIVEIGSQIEI
jgi:KUP system potassium uptake protein